MDSITEPVDRPVGKGSPSNRHAHRGNSKSRNDRGKGGKKHENSKPYGELVSELDGVKGELKDLSRENEEASAKLKSAEARLAIVEAESETNLKIEGLRTDFWIGTPVTSLNWEIILLGLSFVALFPFAAWGWAREAVVGFLGIAFCLLWSCVYVHEDSLGKRTLKFIAPVWSMWYARRTIGSRHIKVIRYLNERHDDLRHDVNSLAKLKHGDACYAVVRVDDHDDDVSDEWTISLELLAQLLAPKFMNPVDSDEIQFERLMREATRFHTVNISRYYRWTEHIYIATAHVAYAHAVHLKERTLGAFVLAPRPMDV